jgi:hypothetical protein
MAEPKTKPTTQAPKDFLLLQPDELRRQDCFTLIDLMQEATGEKAVMWGTSIIGFGKYQYDYASGSKADWPLIGFSPRKNDLTLYLMSGFPGKEELLQKLGKYKVAKSCLYLKRLGDVDRKVLKQLIAKSVKAMKAKHLQ